MRMEAGNLIAGLLSGSWRESPPPLTISAPPPQTVIDIFLKTGASSLAWRVLSRTEFKDLPEIDGLRQAHRLNMLAAAIHERETAQAFEFLRSKGVEPILCKGWAIARLYPERGLRPYGDIDLLIRPEEHARSQAAMLDPDAPRLPLDLHNGSVDLGGDRTFDQLHARSRLVSLLSAEIRVLSAEDHLRLLCLHMLRHGAFRPLWLCDIALALESAPPDFDWDCFFSGNRRRTDWVLCALGLAHAVLGARLDECPANVRARNLPGWLIPALLRQWSAKQFYIIDTSPLKAHLLHPAQALRAIRLRWPNPIHATVEMGAEFNELPRLPYQIADGARRATLFALRLMRLPR